MGWDLGLLEGDMSLLPSVSTLNGISDSCPPCHCLQSFGEHGNANQNPSSRLMKAAACRTLKQPSPRLMKAAH